MHSRINLEPEMNEELERPVIDIKINSKKKIFDILSFFVPRFRVLRFLYKHKNLKVSLPIAKRNTTLLFKGASTGLLSIKSTFAWLFKGASTGLLSIKSTLEQLLRRGSDSCFFFQSMCDEMIINRLPEEYINLYIKIVPYVSQGINLVPVFFIYYKIEDDIFLILHFFGPWRTLYLWKYPIRLALSSLMYYFPFDITILIIRYRPNWFYQRVKSMGYPNFMRKVMLCIALCAEIFGETIPNERILVDKPLTSKVSKSSFCNKTFLNNLQKQRYDPKNLPLLDLMLDQDKDFSIQLEIIPDFPHCIGEKSLEQKVLRTKILGKRRKKTLQYRKKLRIRSEFQAKKIRNSIKRILLF